MYLLYSAALAAALIVGLPYWLFRMLRHGKYQEGLRERLGWVPARLAAKSAQPTIWVHAVSVGEVLAISGLVEQMCRRLGGHRIVISTTTSTGQKLARQRFGDEVFYFPLDFAFAIRPYLRALRPELIVLAETEFWPNFLRLAKGSGAQVAVVNARISDRSLTGYLRMSHWLAPMLRNISLFLAQTHTDAERLRAIGVAGEKIQVIGNLKFDASPPEAAPIMASLRATFEQSAAGPVLVCGSTVDGEEPIVMQAFVNVLASHPRAVMILAPRHPERFAAVGQLLEKLGIRYWKRSLWSGENIAGGVLLVDTIGELASLYALADVAFIGGSLVPRGGHNILEAAQHGAAIIVGNHTENFRDMIQLFQARDAVRVTGPAEFPLILMELLSNDSQRHALGRRAFETLRSQTGATQRTLEALEKLLSQTTSGGSPVGVPTSPVPKR
ncbi:MAG TPA: 3-deoxy-D-manno-octulosonic acid transferase [Terriglobales bacterium]|nr:3-deoxy-D-manno-octulosonic acid transferase [Terriglobales bacterium]